MLRKTKTKTASSHNANEKKTYQRQIRISCLMYKQVGSENGLKEGSKQKISKRILSVVTV